MALKTFNPTTPSRRELVIVDRGELWKGKPVKSLTVGLRGKGGRNNTGRITLRRRGGGHKHRYRIVDFKRTKTDVPAVGRAARIRSEPDRVYRAHRYGDGEHSYISRRSVWRPAIRCLGRAGRCQTWECDADSATSRSAPSSTMSR